MATALKTAAPSTALSPVEQFKLQILPPDKAAQIARALPPHIRPERFERNLLNALMQTPDLMKCDPRMVYREVSKSAALGLLLDPQLGEAYLIVGWNGRTQSKEPQLRIGYRGVMKLARQSGDVAAIYAHEVCANDEIECLLGDNKKLVHKPTLFGERGPVIGFYSVVRFKDGETDFEPMTIEQVNQVRDNYSDGWKAFKNNKIKSTPWSTSYDEMAKKTVIRKLLKRIPQSPDLMMDAMRVEDEAESPRDITPLPAADIASPAADVAAMLAAVPDGEPDHDVIESPAALSGVAQPDPAYQVVMPEPAGVIKTPNGDEAAPSPHRDAFERIRKAIRAAKSEKLVDQIMGAQAEALAAMPEAGRVELMAEAARRKTDLMAESAAQLPAGAVFK